MFTKQRTIDLIHKVFANLPVNQDSSIPRNNDELVEMIADREGLAGKPRAEFKDFLREYYTFARNHQRRVRHMGRSLLILTLLFMLLAARKFMQVENIHGARAAVYYGVIIVVYAVAFLGMEMVHARSSRFRSTLRPFADEWRDYCQNFRPSIKRDLPELISDDRGKE